MASFAGRVYSRYSSLAARLKPKGDSKSFRNVSSTFFAWLSLIMAHQIGGRLRIRRSSHLCGIVIWRPQSSTYQFCRR